MNCPRDNASLVAVRVNGCHLQKCPECEGLWLDQGELEEILKLGAEEVESRLRKCYDQPHEAEVHAEGYMRCPKCPSGRLQKVRYTIIHPVRIERCDECLGFWMDHSELDAIVSEKAELDALDSRTFGEPQQSPGGAKSAGPLSRRSAW